MHGTSAVDALRKGSKGGWESATVRAPFAMTSRAAMSDGPASQPAAGGPGDEKARARARVGLTINGAAAQTADYLDLTANGGGVG